MRDGTYKRKLDDLLAVCRKNLYAVNEDLIRRAFQFSLEAHRNDMRASGDPFFNHPFEVAMIVAKEIPLDDVSVAAALMHDVAEDTEFTIKDIRHEFGDAVAEIVDGATKISDIFRSHEVTETENYRKMLLSMVNDIRVMLLKFADRLHNMRTLEYLPKEKQIRLAKETLDIYAPFAHRFGLAKIKWELEDLSFKYLYPPDYEELASKLKAKRKEREIYIKKFIQPVEMRFKEEGMKFEIEGRPKHLYSIFHKMKVRGKPLEEIYDLFAVRIILDTEKPNDCFTAYGIITSIYMPIPERFKNYISVPKKNGYQSIHATVVGPDGKMVEIQIRTQGMHEIAEKGVAAHWRYKENVTRLDEELENWISWVRELFERGDSEAHDKQFMESFKLTLYQDEIYLFTPKGELKILPKGASPIDFAYAVHSKVGDHCLSAKVNGKIVPLNHQLLSGDQVEIITSKNQSPKADWEQIVVTHKAKTHIRRWMKEEERKEIESGKETWDKRTRKFRLHINPDDLLVYLHALKIEDLKDFYVKIHKGELNPDTVIHEIEMHLRQPEGETLKEQKSAGFFDRVLHTARSITGGITLFGTKDNILHGYAKCCNPIPGDDIIGFVTMGEGIKVHIRDCANFRKMTEHESQRVVEISWPATGTGEYIVPIYLAGEDRPGMLSDVTHSISTYQNTNIRTVKIDTKDKMFEGTIMVIVKDKVHLERIIEKIRKIPGVMVAKRLTE
jgi:RelA/SpoT family (p)ppGpp synthetase